MSPRRAWSWSAKRADRPPLRTARLADAANVVRFPGLVTYETKLDPPAVAGFYQGAMPGAGYSPVGDAWVGPMGATVADDVSGMFASFGFPVTATDGTVWVDAQTGALLKADVGYKAAVKDTAGKIRARTTGHVTLAESAIGASPVSLP